MNAVYRFGRCELQLAEQRLLVDGAAVALGRRAFAVLACLVEQAGHLVSKDQLFHRAWHGAVVGDNAMQFQISTLRKVVGHAAIATVSGQGYRFMPAVTPVDGTGTAAAPASRHNLPPAPTPFIGRHRDIRQLQQALQRARLLTLTGTGGCGKTRLALHVASSALGHHADGVWWVELAALAAPSLLPQAVMVVLDIQEKAGESPVQTLLARLASRRLLLVLDNAEHLLAACAELADQLLNACPGVELLVTSRQALGVLGEQRYRVPSLSLPDSTQTMSPEQLLASESAQLFVERARLLQPQFQVTVQNAQVLALICRQLDGIPLAIELAAGRMRSMPVEELGRRLHQRFSLLTGGAPGALPRHRTLRSLIDWSYDLLGVAEQALLCRLSVFAGGCTLASAEQVCTADAEDRTAVAGLLASLCDKNLLAADEQDGGLRYQLLETVRQYGRERLRDAGQVVLWQAAHLRHFAAMADAVQAELQRGNQRSGLDQLELEIDNLRAALGTVAQATCADEDEDGPGLGLTAALGYFWMVRGHFAEGRAWSRAVLSAVQDDSQRANSPAPDSWLALRARVINNAANLAALQGDYAAARAGYAQALDIWRVLDDQRSIARTMSNLGIIAGDHGDYAQATLLHQSSVAILRSFDDPRSLAASLTNLGNVARRQGDHAAGEAAFAEVLDIQRRRGDQHGAAFALTSWGASAARRGQHQRGRQLLAEALTLQHELGELRGVAEALVEFAELETLAGPGVRCACLWAAAEQLRQQLGVLPSPMSQAHDLQQLAAARAALGDDAAFDAAWQQGQALTTAQAVRYALEPGRADGAAG